MNIKILKNEIWKNHPWSKNDNVKNLSVDFLLSIANPYSTNKTNMHGNNKDLFPEDIVWKNIEKEGMIEPILIVIGTDKKTIRLEAGNHRVKMAKKNGYTHLPTSIIVMRESIINKGNGEHVFDANKIINWNSLFVCNYPHQISPKDCFLDSSVIL